MEFRYERSLAVQIHEQVAPHIAGRRVSQCIAVVSIMTPDSKEGFDGRPNLLSRRHLATRTRPPIYGPPVKPNGDEKGLVEPSGRSFWRVITMPSYCFWAVLLKVQGKADVKLLHSEDPAGHGRLHSAGLPLLDCRQRCLAGDCHSCACCLCIRTMSIMCSQHLAAG